MKRKKRPTKPPAGPTYSELFRDDLLITAKTRPDLFREAADGDPVPGWRTARLSLDTAAMPRSDGGLVAEAQERVLVLIKDDPDYPPRVYVDHGRFVGVPHVLTDGELCIYLDPQREWDPEMGAAEFLNRLHDWFADGIANRFDASTALYHPVGGRAHTSSNTPLVVCRDEPPDTELGFARLKPKGDVRIDLRHDDGTELGAGEEKALVVRAPGPLFAGPGATVRDVFANLGPLLAEKALVAWSHRITRQRRDSKEFTHVVLTVPPSAGGAPYVMIGRLSIAALDNAATPDAVGALPIQWCRLDDQRPSISTRRDAYRPVRDYLDRDIVVAGCGGLGSWIAEFLARAGARSIALVDPAIVKGGLLIRQDFTDADLGYRKDESLARRLQSIAPDCAITHGDQASEHTATVIRTDGGALFDATVSLAFGRRLDDLLGLPDRRCCAVRVATDVGTGSLGMMVVSAPGGPALDVLDLAANGALTRDGQLEPYHTFWRPSEHDELVPARGCSIPTFHGSAADMAAVAAEITNLAAPHLDGGISGVHLFALPHAGVEPPHAFFTPDQLGVPSASNGQG